MGRAPLPILLFSLWPLCASLSFAACVKPKVEPPRSESVKAALMADNATHILNRDEPWYEHPAQARPANGQLSANTRVRVLQDAGSYTKVQTAEGKVCFVASDALTPIAAP